MLMMTRLQQPRRENALFFGRDRNRRHRLANKHAEHPSVRRAHLYALGHLREASSRVMSAEPPPAKRARADGAADGGVVTADDPADGGVPTSVAPATATTATDAAAVTSKSSGANDPDEENATGDTGSGRIKKRKVSIFLAYVGKGYQGFQRNPGAVTVEDELERAIVAAGGISADNAGDFSKVGWTRAARTDKGVSAVGQSISLRMMLEHPTDRRDVITRINEKLPVGFEMFGYTRVTGGFNAKTMCDRRRYEYVIPTCAFDPKQCRPRAEVEAEAELARFDETPAAEALAETRPFVFDTAARDRVQNVLRNYCGTHNFHNYTVRVSPDDPAAMRYILSFDCSMPFVVNGVEFVRTTVVGQSFMLHQIRKLIGTMLGVVRGAWSEEDQIFALNTKEHCQTPMAPELGLFLCECIYHAYNARFGETHEALHLDAYADKVEAFKTTHIYPHMAETEKEESTMRNWIRTLPVRQVRASFEAARKKDGGKWEETARTKAKASKKSGKRKAADAEKSRAAEGGAKAGDEAMNGTTRDVAEDPKPTPSAEPAEALAAVAAPTLNPSPSPTVDVSPPPPPGMAHADAAGSEGAPVGYARPPVSRGDAGGDGSKGGGGGRGGRDGPSRGVRGGRGRGRGRGRGGPKNQVRNAHGKSEHDFDPAELSE